MVTALRCFVASFSPQAELQFLDCATPQDGSLGPGHHSVAHTAGEKQHTSAVLSSAAMVTCCIPFHRTPYTHVHRDGSVTPQSQHIINV